MAPSMRAGKRRYKCLGSGIGRACPAPAFVTEEALVPVIEAVFFDRLDEIVAEPASVDADVEALRSTRDRAYRQLVAYRDDVELPEMIGHASWKDGLRVKQAELDAADRALAAATSDRSSELPSAATLRTVWHEMDLQTRRQALATLFDAIVVRKHPSRSERLALVDRVRLLPAGGLEGFEVPRSSRNPAPLLNPFPWPRDPDSPWIALREPVLEEAADVR
jgi:hypothetical protein